MRNGPWVFLFGLYFFSLLNATGGIEAAPLPLKVYGALPAAESPVLSPSGKRLAWIVTIDGKRQVFAQDIGKTPFVSAEVGDLKVRSLEWAGEDFVVLTTSSTENLGMRYGYMHELFNVLVLDVAQRKTRFLLESKNTKVLNASFGDYGYVQQDGRWHAYVGTLPLSTDNTVHSTLEHEYWISPGTEVQLTRVDLTSGEMKRVVGGKKNGNGWLLDARGEVIANESYDKSAKKWQLYSGGSHERLLDEHTDLFGESGIIGQGRVPSTVLYKVQGEAGEDHYMEVSLEGEAKPVEILEDWDVKRFVFNPVTRQLAGAVRDGNEPELVMFDAALQARVRGTRKAFPGYTVRFHSWSDDFNRFVVSTEGADDAGTWWLVDIATGQAKEIGWTHPAIKGASVGPYRLVRYKATDGLELEGILTLPPGIKPEKLPVVVLPHGGPESRDYPEFNWWAQAFASRGYAVWQPNFRGSAGYGIQFRNAGFGEWGRKMQTDISDGVAELERQGIVDARRACIVGGSYGGYAALAGVTVQQGLYRCAVSVAGVASPKDMMLEDLTKNRFDEARYWLAFMGVKSPRSDELDTVSPVKLAAQADAPVLLIHGKDDTVVPFSQSVRMQRALKAAAKPVELVVLQGEDHWLSRESTRIAMLEAAVGFVLQHNPP